MKRLPEITFPSSLGHQQKDWSLHLTGVQIIQLLTLLLQIYWSIDQNVSMMLSHTSYVEQKYISSALFYGRYRGSKMSQMLARGHLSLNTQ